MGKGKGDQRAGSEDEGKAEKEETTLRTLQVRRLMPAINQLRKAPRPVAGSAAAYMGRVEMKGKLLRRQPAQRTRAKRCDVAPFLPLLEIGVRHRWPVEFPQTGRHSGRGVPRLLVAWPLAR